MTKSPTTPDELGILLTSLRDSGRWERILEWFDRVGPPDADVHAVLSAWWPRCHFHERPAERALDLFTAAHRAGLVRDDESLDAPEHDMRVYRVALCDCDDVFAGASWSEDADVVRRRFLPTRLLRGRAAVHSAIVPPSGVLGRFSRPSESEHCELEVVVDPTQLREIHCTPVADEARKGSIRRFLTSGNTAAEPCC